MKYILITYLTLFFAIIGRTQTIMVSDEIQMKADFKYEALPMEGGGVLIFKDEIFEQSIVSFSATMKKEWTKKLSFEEKRIGFIGLASMNNKFTIFYYIRDRSNIYIVSRKYSSNAEMIKTDTISREIYTSGSPKYYFKRSPSDNLALIFSINKSRNLYGYCVDIESNKTLWKHQMIKTDNSLNQMYREVLLTDNADAYFLFERNNRFKKRKKHKFEILWVNKNEQTIELDMNSLLSYDSKITLNKSQDKIYMASVYSVKANNKINGIKSFVIDLPSFTLERTAKLDFRKDLSDTPNLQKMDNKNGILDLTLRNIIPRKDGGFIAICESSKEYTRRPAFSSSSAITRRWVDYYFEDILVFSLNGNDALDWYEVLHKKQYSQDDDAAYSSFFMFQIPAQLRLIFNDEIRNANTVSEYILSSSGQLERKSLMSTDHQNLRLRFRDAIQTSNNEILVPSFRSNKMVWVKIKYENFWRL